MSNVVEPQRKAEQQGSIWCEPLKLYFPKVFRIWNCEYDSNVYGMTEHMGFTLDANALAGQTGIILKPIERLEPSDVVSLVVRHHWSESLASSYLDAVEDLSDRGDGGAIFETDDGVFTLVERTTRAGWPGPMIIYTADLFDADNSINAEHFEVVVDPYGPAVARELLRDI